MRRPLCLDQLGHPVERGVPEHAILGACKFDGQATGVWVDWGVMKLVKDQGKLRIIVGGVGVKGEGLRTAAAVLDVLFEEGLVSEHLGFLDRVHDDFELLRGEAGEADPEAVVVFAGLRPRVRVVVVPVGEHVVAPVL